MGKADFTSDGGETGCYIENASLGFMRELWQISMEFYWVIGSTAAAFLGWCVWVSFSEKFAYVLNK